MARFENKQGNTYELQDTLGMVDYPGIPQGDFFDHEGWDFSATELEVAVYGDNGIEWGCKAYVEYSDKTENTY